MSAAISARPSHRPYQPRRPQTQEHEDKSYPGGPKLYRQMIAGFTFTALFGLGVLSLGAAFLKDAIDSEYSISVMLCIMGIVCGLIIVVGTGILGRIFLSRKFRRTGSHSPPQGNCFHTCSIIYTPSQDQLAFPIPTEQPPPYEATMMNNLPPGGIPQHGETTQTVEATIALPPKYSDIATPPPKYSE